MLKSATGAEPEYELKHRLTGAVILVVAAVLVIPLLLSQPVPDGSGVRSDSTGDDSVFRSRIVPLDIGGTEPAAGQGGGDLAVANLEDQQPALLDLTESTADGQADASEGTGPEPDQAAPDTPSRPALVMTRIPDSVGTQDSETAKPTAAAKTPVEGGWFVRVGTFSDKSNADRMSKRLTDNGYEPRMTSVSTGQGKSTRVSLGPFGEREKADEISNRLKSLVGEKGYVTRDGS